MYATNYFETLILNTLRGQSAPAPSAVYFALFMNNPDETGGGTEVSYSGYARQPVVFSAPAALNGGIGIQNVSEITFPITGVGIGNVTHLAVMDSLGGGNMLLYGAFTEPLNVEANEAPVIVPGEAQWWGTGQATRAFRTKALNMLLGQPMNGFTTYAALYDGDPENGGSELSGENYARVRVEFSAPVEQVGGQMQIANAETVTFPSSSTVWGMWTHTVFMDAATAGAPVYAIPRTPSKEIRRGMRVIYDPGTINLSVN